MMAIMFIAILLAVSLFVLRVEEWEQVCRDAKEEK